MVITAQIIAAGTGASASISANWVAPLQRACDTFNVRTGSAVAALLCNIGVESGGLTTFVENLNYSAQRLAEVWPSRFAVDPKAKPVAPNFLARTLDRKPEAIANSVYAGRIGNGVTASGDGWKYRGQGPIQITGKSNFLACGASIGVDLENHPELLQQPGPGALSAAWFFSSKGCVSVADLGDIAEVIKRVNGALPNAANQGPLRLSRYAACLKLISASVPA